MPFMGNSPDRAALDTGTAAAISKIKTIMTVVWGKAGCGRHAQIRNNTSAAMGNTADRDKTITQTEGTKTGNIGGVAF
jgi:hypothetical protein